MKEETSRKLYTRAVSLMPGGVSSPVRAFGAVGGTPSYIVRGSGSHLWDADGNEYVDYVLSWGPLLLGHAHPRVLAAVQEAAAKGTTFGAPTALEVELAQRVVEAMPSIERVRFVSSGTEATMTALRIARAATGRDRVIKFAGCYHGHADAFLVQAGSGAATLGIPSSSGVPAALADLTVVASYNDLVSVEAAFQRYPGEIACVFVEPVAANMGVVPPEPGFLEGLRDLSRSHGALLIFDEVITGFRLSYHGAQGLHGIRPDLTTLGKVLGGGLPVGAVGGRRELMEMLAPTGPVYQAGTLSGNPIAMAAGICTLDELRRSDPYPALEDSSRALVKGLREAAHNAGATITINGVGSLLTVFFQQEVRPVRSWAEAERVDRPAYARFFHAMRERGVYLPPSQFEAWFLSAAHSELDIAQTVQAAHQAFAAAVSGAVAETSSLRAGQER
ncbi:MAG: glutamate-1-semialdehyde 2,1-aminomutase [Chloroflexi bacterium]|nr:glutamate-1-semialdehyde 2,1-aminomutase [Chloroflexota bacterium]